MNITTVFTEKRENSIKLKKLLWIMQKYKPLWLVKLSDDSFVNELIEWLKTLPSGFVIYSKWSTTEKLSNNIIITWELNKSFISGFDFLVCDDEIENLISYIDKWITPIIIRDNHMATILKEFDPLKNDWNTFFYDELNKWSIFYSIVRYMENYKFPQDNRNLIKNVLKI